MLKKLLTLPFFLLIFFSAEITMGQVFDASQLRVMLPPETEDICTLEPTDIDAHFFIGPSREMDERLKQSATSTFEVDYRIFTDDDDVPDACGYTIWPDDAREAFDLAIDIWSTHLRSDVPIKIDAVWRNIESEPGFTTLGNAGPTRIVQPRPQIDIGELNTWYSIAQLSAMNSFEFRNLIADVDYDIIVNINCDFENWYFGTDASVPDGQTDLITVVLHEIGHGIGFIGSASGNNETRTGDWGTPLGTGAPLPYVYDIFVEDADYFSLLNETIYPNPSGQIYNALIGRRGGLFFEGEDAALTLEEEEADRAKLYTPDPYRPGSSYSHVDQKTFERTVNALMMPRIDRATAIHTPGPLFCGMLSDMGWPLGAGCLSFLASDAIIAVSETELDFGVTNIGENIQLSMTIRNEPGAIETLSGAVEISGDEFILLSDNTFSLEPGQNTTVNLQYTPGEEGQHTGTISVLHNANNVQSPISIPLQGEALEEDKIVKLEQSYPNPVVPTTPNPTIPYAISRDSDVSLDLYSINGHHLQSLVQRFQNSGRYEVEVDMQGLSSGIYIYRIIVDNVAESGRLMYFK